MRPSAAKEHHGAIVVEFDAVVEMHFASGEFVLVSTNLGNEVCLGKGSNTQPMRLLASEKSHEIITAL